MLFATSEFEIYSNMHRKHPDHACTQLAHQGRNLALYCRVREAAGHQMSCTRPVAEFLWAFLRTAGEPASAMKARSIRGKSAQMSLRKLTGLPTVHNGRRGPHRRAAAGGVRRCPRRQVTRPQQTLRTPGQHAPLVPQSRCRARRRGRQSRRRLPSARRLLPRSRPCR